METTTDEAVMSQRKYSRQGRVFETERNDEYQGVEVSGELPGGTKVRGRAPANHAIILLLIVVTAVLVYLAIMIKMHDDATRSTGTEIVKSVRYLTDAIRLQSCLSTLPAEERRSAYANPSSSCNFLSKER